MTHILSLSPLYYNPPTGAQPAVGNPFMGTTSQAAASNPFATQPTSTAMPQSNGMFGHQAAGQFAVAGQQQQPVAVPTSVSYGAQMMNGGSHGYGQQMPPQQQQHGQFGAHAQQPGVAAGAQPFGQFGQAQFATQGQQQQHPQQQPGVAGVQFPPTSQAQGQFNFQQQPQQQQQPGQFAPSQGASVGMPHGAGGFGMQQQQPQQPQQQQQQPLSFGGAGMAGMAGMQFNKMGQLQGQMQHQPQPQPQAGVQLDLSGGFGAMGLSSQQQQQQQQQQQAGFSASWGAPPTQQPAMTSNPFMASTSTCIME